MLNGVVNTAKDYLAGVIDISEVMLCCCQLHRRSTGSIEYPCDCLKKKIRQLYLGMTIGIKKSHGKISDIYYSYIHYSLCIYCIFCILTRFSFPFLCSIKSLVQAFILLNFQFSNIVQFLFDYCSVF